MSVLKPPPVPPRNSAVQAQKMAPESTNPIEAEPEGNFVESKPANAAAEAVQSARLEKPAVVNSVNATPIIMTRVAGKKRSEHLNCIYMVCCRYSNKGVVLILYVCMYVCMLACIHVYRSRSCCKQIFGIGEKTSEMPSSSLIYPLSLFSLGKKFKYVCINR